MCKMLCALSLRDLFDGADFLASLSGLTFQSTSFFLKEEKASSVSASCTLNCLSCEDNPYCLRAVAVHTPLSWQIREVSNKSTLYWDKGRYCDYFFCFFLVVFFFFFKISIPKAGSSGCL